MPEGPTEPQQHTRLSWKEGLFLVGPDPLTSPYYSSGALILAGVGYATPGFQIGLYGLLFLLAPLYIEAVLLTLSNGGTYVMTRYALSHLGKLATIAAAIVGVVISFSYVATAIVSLLSYSDYVGSLVSGLDSGRTVAAIGLSAIPSLGFGVWVMPKRWRQTLLVVVGVSVLAIALSPIIPSGVVVMLAPLMLLFMLNNQGLKESVQVSKTIFLANLVVMAVTILFGLIWLLLHDFGHYELFFEGHEFRRAIEAGAGPAPAHPLAEGEESIRNLPGIATLGAALIPAALGSSILGASGVESVMNIPEELESPRTDIRRIYMWMLSILLAVGGTLALLVFLVLPPKDLVGAAGYLLAVLGRTTVSDVTGSEALGSFWNVVIVANAALMLLGATNTGFAGARGLWVTMARDNLLPRIVLDTNDRGAFSRIHLLMLIAIFALCWEGEADSEVLERWYGATFGLVMFSGVFAFVLLRKFKARDRRIYTAPFNISLGGLRVPIAALIGTAFLAFALLGLYDRYSEQINDLRALIVTMAMLVGAVLLGYNHRPLIRMVHTYFRRTVETVEGEAIETGERTIVVAVADVRMTRLIDQAISLARVQSRVTGIPYTQIVVFHMTASINREHVYRVERNSMRPASVEGNIIRIHTELTERAPEDIRLFLALVPKRHREMDNLEAAMEELGDFHERHGFRGHIVMIGDVGVTEAVSAKLQERLQGSTLVTVPVS